MITREMLRELAAFQSAVEDAVTFYYQPTTPQDKSHRQETIFLKDLVRNALLAAEKEGKNGDLRLTLGRVMEQAERLHGNQGNAKAVFACSSQNYWREFDLPPSLPETRLIVNRRFHLAPISGISDRFGKVSIALVDRTKARLFEMNGKEIREVADLANGITRRGRSDGFFGFDAGHAERRVDNESQAHYRRVGERLMELYGNGGVEYFILGSHEELRSSIEKELHPYTRQRLIGFFRTDPAVTTPDEIRQQAQRIASDDRERVRKELISEVLDEAKANNRGALGLRRVLKALQMGEVQSLFLERSFGASGAECPNCGYLDMAHAKYCAVCNHEMREIDDLEDAMIGRALSQGADIAYITQNEDLQKHGNVAALLRFRAERSIGERVAV